MNSNSVNWTDEQTWSGTRAAMTASTGLLPGAYTDDGFFGVEQQQVFEQAWVCVGIADEVAASGRLLVRNLGTRSIIITRDGDGVLQGFLNSCRHRGTELAEQDCEVSNTIRCPYHRWGYGLDGRLNATPFFEDVPRESFDKSDFGLVPVRVETWGVLLFACLSPQTPPLLDWLGDLPERMAGYDLDAWTSHHTQALEIDANWKLISENFQEYYHLAWVHPELAKVSRVADHYRYQGPGMYCGQTVTPVTGQSRDDWLVMPPAVGLDESDGVSGRFIAIFPNVLLSVLPNHVWVMRLDPLAPGRTSETCTLLAPSVHKDIDATAAAATLKFWLDVNAEDIDIVERGQRGLARGSVPPGPLAPRFEEPLHRFHNMLADHMTRTSVTPAAVTVPRGDRPDDPADRWGTAQNPTPPQAEQPVSLQ